MFSEGDDVLMKGEDGLLYLGVVVEIENDESMLIRFGDGDEKWGSSRDLRPLGGGGSGAGNDGGVDNFRPPTPPPPILAPYDGHFEIPHHVLRARKELPYDFDDLLWDENHQRNDKERYCYCGESGDW